jgi:cystathionine beta-lyase/cystathionine gamma-synthase
MEADDQLRLEDLKLYDEYPEQYVAWMDIWEIQGEVRTLQRRILAHDQNAKTMSEQLKEVLSREQIDPTSVRSMYIEDPEQGLGGRFAIGE